MNHMTRNDIIAEAASWLGTPYHHRASLKGVGCDCLGLVRGIYRALYGPEPREVPAYPQYNDGSESERLIAGLEEHLLLTLPPGKPGDVLVFRLRAGFPARHCAVLVEPKCFIHAVSGRSVSLVALFEWWVKRIAGVFGFPQVE